MVDHGPHDFLDDETYGVTWGYPFLWRPPNMGVSEDGKQEIPMAMESGGFFSVAIFSQVAKGIVVEKTINHYL